MERFREFMGDESMDEEELLFAERRATVRLVRGLQSWDEMQRTSAVSIQALYRGVRVRRELKLRLKMHKHRSRVVKELLSTEQSYRDGLALMLEVIYTPLSWNASHSTNPILTAGELHLLFSNFVQIQSLSGQLCDLFKERIDTWYQGRLIADIFTKFGAFLKIYTVYCNHFDEANNLMQQVEQRENFRLFWEPIRQLHNVGTLGSFLIMPVQRIPRYVLLLRDLLKSTWEDHPDYENIGKALELVESIGSQVNLAMKSNETSSEMSEAQNAFGAFITVLSPTRRFLQRGKLLLLKQATTEEVVTVWLFNDLVIISDFEEFVGGYTYKGSIHLKDSTGKSTALLQDLQDMEFIRNVFRISSGTSAYTLSAPTVEEKTKWVGALQDILGNATMLSATVLGTAQRQDAKGRYTVYVIEVTGIGGAKRRIYKRYSEFDQLDYMLKQTVPELHSIHLPPKRLFGQSSKELERRIVALGLYLQQLLLREDAPTKELLRTFLEDFDGVLVGPPDESGDEHDGQEEVASSASSSFDTHSATRPALLKSMSSFLGKKTKRSEASPDATTPDQSPGFGRSLSSPASQESTLTSKSFAAPKLRGLLSKNKSRQGSTFTLGGGGAVGNQRVSVFLANGSTVPLTLSSSTRTEELIQLIAAEIALPVEMASDFGIFICTSPSVAVGHGKMSIVIDSRPLEPEEFPLRVLLARRSATTDARLLFQKAQWFPADDEISHPTLAKLMFYQIQRDVEENEFPCSIEHTAKMTALLAQATLGNMNSEKAKEFQATNENLTPRFCASKTDLVTNTTTVADLAGGLELRMFALSFAEVHPDESGQGDFTFRLWSGTQERMPLTARALHFADFQRWTQALSEKVLAAPVEEGDPVLTTKLRDAAKDAPINNQDLFQQVARGYISGAQSAQAEGWMTKPSRSGGAKGWKLRWFVLVDRYLLYFKQRPKMRLNADHWRGMVNAHWRSFSGNSVDQVHTTYLQIAQEYPFYGCTCFSVTFDKNASRSCYELPSDVVLGIRYDCVLVMEPGEKYLLQRFENHQIEQIRHFPGDLRLHIIGVKEPIVFKTTIAYDIRRIFQDYRAPQRHLVVSERSADDDRVMPFRMDSERSVDDSVGLPTPSSSPPAVPPKPAALQPPVAGTNAQPALAPFSMKSKSADTVESTPASESPVLATAMPAFPTLSILNTSEVDSEDSFVQDGKQSDSVKSQSPMAQQGLSSFFKLKRHNKNRSVDAGSGSPTAAKGSLFPGFRRNKQSPTAQETTTTTASSNDQDDEDDFQRAEDLRVSFSHIGGIGSRVSVAIKGSNPMSALQSIEESSSGASHEGGDSRNATQKATQLKNMFFRPRQQAQTRAGRRSNDTTPNDQTGSPSNDSTFMDANPLAPPTSPLRTVSPSNSVPDLDLGVAQQPSSTLAATPPKPHGKPPLPGMPRRPMSSAQSNSKLAPVLEDADDAPASTVQHSPIRTPEQAPAASRPPVPAMPAPTPPGVATSPITQPKKEAPQQPVAAKRPPVPSHAAPPVPGIAVPASSKPPPPVPQRKSQTLGVSPAVTPVVNSATQSHGVSPGSQQSSVDTGTAPIAPKAQWPPLPAPLPAKAAPTTVATNEATTPTSSTTPTARSKVAELASLVAARDQKQQLPPEPPSRPVPPGRGRVAELAAKATAAMQQPDTAARPPSASTRPAPPVPPGRGRVAELAAKATAAMPQPDEPTRPGSAAPPVPPGRGRVAELAAKTTATIQQPAEAARPPSASARPGPPVPPARGRVAELAAKAAAAMPQPDAKPPSPTPRPITTSRNKVAELAATIGPAVGGQAATSPIARSSSPNRASPSVGKLARAPLPLPGRGPPPSFGKPNSPPPPPPDLHANGRPPPVPQKRRPKSVKPSSILQNPPR